MRRAPSEFERIYGSAARRWWMWRRPCAVRGCATTGWVPDGRRAIEIAHARTGGMGRKEDAEWTVPLCWRHHDMRPRQLAELGLVIDGQEVASLEEAAGLTHEAWVRYENALAF